MYQKIDDPIFALYNCESLLSPALYHKYTNGSIHSTCIIKIVSILTVSISIIHNLPFLCLVQILFQWFKLLDFPTYIWRKDQFIKRYQKELDIISKIKWRLHLSQCDYTWMTQKTTVDCFPQSFFISISAIFVNVRVVCDPVHHVR